MRAVAPSLVDPPLCPAKAFDSKHECLIVCSALESARLFDDSNDDDLDEQDSASCDADDDDDDDGGKVLARFG